MIMDKYLWLTDCHLWSWNRYKLLRTILDQKPKGVFITGDISNCSQTLIWDLDFLGERVGRPIYFIPANHDYYLSSFKETNDKIHQLSLKHKNLIWMEEIDLAPLNDEACVIGSTGWYDARVGNPEYLKYTFDWFMIKEFRELPSMQERIQAFRERADYSAKILSEKLEKALDIYKTVYLLTHFPPYREANRANGWISDKFFEPYNINYILGQELDKIMIKHKKRRLVVLCGHSHLSCSIFPARNIECRVGKGSYHKLSEEEILYI